jgi:hypothetical protein
MMRVVISPIHLENGEYVDGDITLDNQGHVHHYSLEEFNIVLQTVVVDKVANSDIVEQLSGLVHVLSLPIKDSDQYLWMVCRFLEDGNFRTVQLEHDENVIAAPREIIDQIVWLHLLTDDERENEARGCTIH